MTGPAQARALSFRDRLSVHLRLGRVSNLPTVWSNVLAAAIVSGAVLAPGAVLAAILACSAMYIGGMYLNDAMDAEIDTRERAERPIPCGLISRRQVLQYSIVWFVAGLIGFYLARAFSAQASTSNYIPSRLDPIANTHSQWAAHLGWIVAPLALLACIIAYNRFHKNNPFGPALMASCRALVYLSVGYVLTSQPAGILWLGAGMAFLWIMALTALAKREFQALAGNASTLPDWPLALLVAPVIVSLVWVPTVSYAIMLISIVLVLLIVLARRRMRSGLAGDFPRGVGLLIAGMALVDALAIARTGISLTVLVAAPFATACAGLTVLLQRRISGT